MMEKLKQIYKNFIGILKKPEMQILPGHLAFYLLMSFIPIIALAALLASFFLDSFQFLEYLSASLPDNVFDLVESAFLSARSYNNFALLFVFYLIMGSNGPSAIIAISNTLYGVEQPRFFKGKIKAILLTLVLIFLFLFLILVIGFGEPLIHFVFKLIGNYSNQTLILRIYQVGKWLLSVLVVFVLVKIIYKIAPDKKIPFHSTTIGALFTAISWTVATEAFVFYVTKIAKYDLLYGNFAHILILLLWIYLLAYLFVIGMALNRNWDTKEYVLLKK